jgi:hypothetical protein
MKEIPLTGSILKTVSDIDIQQDLNKPEGKSIASLINEQEENNENNQEQEPGQAETDSEQNKDQN